MLKLELDYIILKNKKLEEKDARKISKLIDEFRDELFLNEKYMEANLLKDEFNRRYYSSSMHQTGLEFVNLATLEGNHPLNRESDFFQEAKLKIHPATDKIAFFITARNPRIISGGESKKTFFIDEASVIIKAKNYAFTIGRQYFIIDRLGLIADNVFDSFEAARLDIKYKLQFTYLFSRLSSTNYPYRTIFIDADDYHVFRVAHTYSEFEEYGFTYLASGIATERAASFDFYKKIGNREFIGEYAIYIPSETNYTLENRNAKNAAVFGFDVYSGIRNNLFLQTGYIEKDFTPMASSLLYSAGEHLYFDQNTYGLDITFTHFFKKPVKNQFDLRLDSRLKITPVRRFEIEAVYLNNTDNTRNMNRLTFRFIHQIKNVILYFEGNLFDVYKSTLFENVKYYNLRTALSYAFL